RTDIQSGKLADVCRPNGYVRVAFRQGDERWEVTRGFTTKKESYLELTRDGEAVQGTIPDKERTIRDVVGLDYDGFRNSTFVRQEEMKELGRRAGRNDSRCSRSSFVSRSSNRPWSERRNDSRRSRATSRRRSPRSPRGKKRSAASPDAENN